MNRNTVVDPSPRQLGERQRKRDFFSYTWTTYSLFVCLFWSLSSYSIIFHARTTRDYKKKRWILFQRFIRCPCMQVFFVLKTEEISTAFEISWFLIITWNYAWFRILRIDWCSASSSLLYIVYLNWRSGLLSNYLLIHTVIVFSSQRSSKIWISHSDLFFSNTYKTFCNV